MKPGDEGAAQRAEDDGSRLLALITALITELHRRPPATPPRLDADLERDLGMDSLARVELLSRAERHFHLPLSERAFTEARIARDLLPAIAQARRGRRTSAERAARIVPQPAETAAARAAPADIATLTEVLQWHARHHPQRVHLRFYGDDAAGGILSYGALLDGASRVAAGLQALGIGKGDTVVLMLQTGADYFFCFFGTLLAGGVPVPIYPPARPAQIEDHVHRQRAIIANCGAAVLITLPEARKVARLLRDQVETLQHVVTAAELATTGGRPQPVTLHADDLAFVQYTSGSTGQPKGVMLSHANLLANIRAITSHIGAGPDDVCVSWLPLYHDMGLIGAWLGSLYSAAELVVMSPLAFIARPQRWLEAIHEHGGTLSASPNFGYELCLRRIDDTVLAGLDLSRWRCAFNGAEPVSPDTLRRFQDRFGRCGLRAEALMPVYGLAECSVGLAFPRLGQAPRIDRIERDTFLRKGRAVPAGADDAAALSFVSCGHALPAQEIRVVDEDGRTLPERRVGRLLFRGPSATAGYYRNPQATAALLGEGGWLDSGDLAYFADGDIHVTGRVKDIIIHAGRNLYPHELEEAAGKVVGVRPGRVAAFGAPDAARGTERLIIVAETPERDETQRARMRDDIAGAVAGLGGGIPDDVVLAPPGALLKTPSGKIRRTAMRERYERGELARGPAPVWRQLLRLSFSALPKRLRRLGAKTVETIYGVYAQTLFWLLAPFGYLLVLTLPTPGLRWRGLQAVLRLLSLLTGIRLRVHGREHLPSRGDSCVLVCNHAGYLDVAFLILALPSPVGFVAKAELQRNPPVRVFLRRLGVEFVERFDARRGASDSRALSQRLRAGKPLLYFPEGTFAATPGLRAFRMGAFTAAAGTGVPLLPMSLRGSRERLRSGSWCPHPGTVTLTVTPAILLADTDARSAWDNAIELRDRARAAILEHCGEPDLL